MSSSKRLLAVLLGVFLAAGCAPSSGENGATPPGGISGTPIANFSNGYTLPALSGANVMPLTVNGSLCSNKSYPNKPCVAVTVCTPGTNTCQTINDILLDTGSFGLRLFKQTLTVPLTPVSIGGNPLAECVQFGDGSSDWGPVQTADVILGNEPSVRIPIHVLDSTFGKVPSACGTPETGPSAGFNGILGVGLLAQDCGGPCASAPNNQVYYTCNGTSCSNSAAPLASQVVNPVALLPQDNNGVIVELPRIDLGGVPSLNGYLVLGIGTRPNNTPAGVTTYNADPQQGEFSTTFEGQVFSSFIDSGSNALYFQAPSSGVLPDCSSYQSNLAGWFCPPSVQSFSATTASALGSPSSNVLFQIASIVNESTANNVFLEIGADGSGLFDWGLPFYIGRNVYVGIEGKSSSLGNGPYWAY